MTISLLWLQDYLHLTLSPEEVSEALTSLGLEVEKMETWESIQGGMRGVVAGKVLTCAKHPDADRLSITTVDVGNAAPLNIVCGANNIAAGQTVWVALPETELYTPDGKSWTIKSSTIRGQLSEGMICAEDELGLGTDHDGIIVLPDKVVIGTKASDYYQILTDTIFEIGLTPNRSDATSIAGVAADLAAYLSVQTGTFHVVNIPEIPDFAQVTSTRFKVSVKNQIACPRYSGILLTSLRIGPSPDWMQQRLRAIGVKSINNVVDITNFVLHELGQPLHAFDADKIEGQAIIVETKPEGTKFLALDGLTYKLHAEDLMICDGKGKPMCIGGVYGGLNSGVTDSTTSIFLEAAHFNAGWVRRTSMRHNLRTEAAKRFEKGSDPNITLTALRRAVDLLIRYAGAEIASTAFDIYPSPIKPAEVELSLARLMEKSGVAFTIQEVEHILDALQMNYDDVREGIWRVFIPTNKADVLREIDLIEEILRIYGYVRVAMPQKMHTSVAIESKTNPHRFRRLIGQYLASNGFLEAMNMSLTSPAYYKDIPWTDTASWVTIHNTSNESQNLMRPDMIIPTLDMIMRNVNRQQSDLRIFEFGKIYRQEKELPAECERLVITMTGQRSAASWIDHHPGAVDYFSLKTQVMALLKRLGVVMDVMETMAGDGYAFGVVLKNGKVEIGRMGCIDTALTDRFDIGQAVYIADLDLGSLVHLSTHHEVIYEELNRFPSVVRDVAMVLDEKTTFDRVKETVTDAGGAWLKQLEVFDIYRNPDHLGAGRMSMALRLTIEKKESTLTDREIDKWFSDVQKALVKGVKAEIRKG